MDRNPTEDVPLRAQTYTEAVASPKGVLAKSKITPPNECQPVSTLSIQTKLYLAGPPDFRNSIEKQIISGIYSPTPTNQELAKPVSQPMNPITDVNIPADLKPVISGKLDMVVVRAQNFLDNQLAHMKIKQPTVWKALSTAFLGENPSF